MIRLLALAVASFGFATTAPAADVKKTDAKKSDAKKK